MAAALLLSLIDPLRAIAIFPYYLYSGSTYDQMQKAFQSVTTEPCSIVYTASVAMLDDKQLGSQYAINEQGSAIIPTIKMKKASHVPACVVALVQESNSLYQMPSALPLVADYGDRSPYTPLMRSIKLLNSPKGYSFKAFRSELQKP